LPDCCFLRIAVLADAAHVNCQRWCEGLTAAGAEVHLISFADGGSTGITTHRILNRYLPAKLHYFAAVPYVNRLLAAIRPDVVLAYYVTGYGTLGALTGFHPLVQVTSGSDVLKAPDNPFMGLLLRQTLRRADMVTAWAPHMADAVLKLGVRSDRVLVLPRGIPYQQFAEKRTPVPHEHGAVRIISTRSLYPNYKIDLLVKAVYRLLKSGVVCALTICGEGPCREQIADDIHQLGLDDSVHLVGFVSNDKLAGVLSEHDLYVSLIDYDGVSASLLEAMTMGLLPMVPNHAANRDWIHNGENGILLDSLSPDAIAQQIHRAIIDLPLRRRARDYNLEIVKKRADLSLNSKKFLQAFHNLTLRTPKAKFCMSADG
jgi:glycosyltransferase involved in cell wall biosynthesis